MADAQGTVEPGDPAQNSYRSPFRSRYDLDLAEGRRLPASEQLDDSLLGSPAPRQALPPVGTAAGGQFSCRIDAVQETFPIPFAERTDARNGYDVHTELFHTFSITANILSVQLSP